MIGVNVTANISFMAPGEILQMYTSHFSSGKKEVCEKYRKTNEKKIESFLKL